MSSSAAVGDPSLCIAPNQAVLPCLLPLLIGAVPFFSRENEEVCLEEEQPKRDQCCRARSTGLPQLSPMLRSVQSLVPHSPAVLLLLLLLLFSPSRGEMQNLSKEIFIVALRYFKMSAFLSNFNIFLPFFFFNETLNERSTLPIFCLKNFEGGGIIKTLWRDARIFRFCSFFSHWVTVICLHQINVDGFLSESFLALNKIHWM